MLTPVIYLTPVDNMALLMKTVENSIDLQVTSVDNSILTRIMRIMTRSRKLVNYPVLNKKNYKNLFRHYFRYQTTGPHHYTQFVLPFVTVYHNDIASFVVVSIFIVVQIFLHLTECDGNNQPIAFTHQTWKLVIFLMCKLVDIKWIITYEHHS